MTHTVCETNTTNPYPMPTKLIIELAETSTDPSRPAPAFLVETARHEWGIMFAVVIKGVGIV